MNSQAIARYIISFLLREDEALHQVLTEQVGYTRDPNEMKHYKVVIYPSEFFDVDIYATPEAYPSLVPPLWHSTPLLYGSPHVEKHSENGPLIIYADIVASTYFFISRYEEMYFRERRDWLGRFQGKDSYLAQIGCLNRPIVDEYSQLLMEYLSHEPRVNIATLPEGFAKINLTHDIDMPYEYHGWRSFARAWWKEGKSIPESARLAFRSVLQDRFWSFPRFLEWNKEIMQHYPNKCSSIFFYKSPGSSKLDRPNYHLNKYPLDMLRALAEKYNVQEGWHIPVGLSQYPLEMPSAYDRFIKQFDKPIHKARYHFLATGEPEDAHYLIMSGIRDDYSMGFADIAGFRLATSRPVRFIMPNSGTLTNLKLHPLTLMDVTLMDRKYMNLTPGEAFDYASTLLREVAKHHGELNILFHNNLLAREVSPEYSRLYRDILRAIVKIDPIDEPEMEVETNLGTQPWRENNL